MMPLILFNVKEWLSSKTLVLESAKDWNFCIVSHVWGRCHAWKTKCSTSKKVIEVTAFSKKDLTRAAHCIDKLGFEWSWIDTICIDQNSIEEKQREIKKMGFYYANAKQCIIFTGGLYNVGNLLYDDYNVPKWHTRIWTLQETVLSPNAVYLYKVDDITTITNPTRLNKLRGRYVDISDSWIHKKQTYFFVHHSSIKKALESTLDIIHETTKKCITVSQGSIVRNTLTHMNTDDWTLQNVLRECGRRNSTKQEDIVYGVLGLLDRDPDLHRDILNVPIDYNIGIRDAMLRLAQTLPNNKIALLMTCDFTHSAIPDFASTSGRYAAWGLNVDDDCIATARISDNCIHVQTQCTNVSLERTGSGSTINTDKENKPRFPLEQITLTKNAHNNIACFGIMLGFKNNVRKNYTLMLIGTTKEKWATTALQAENVGICVVVNADTGSNTHKEGLVIIDHSKFEWDKKDIPVSLYPTHETSAVTGHLQPGSHLCTFI